MMPHDASPTRLRVLVVHNAYRHRGGEDAVVDSEVALLRQHGHEVRTYLRHNDEVQGQSNASLAWQTVWSRETVAALESLFAASRPDVIHVHNTQPLVSPSVFWVAHRHRIPVVMTLHNFRLLCPQALLLREGRVCEDCVGRLPWRGVVRKCYRDSAAQTAVVSAMLGVHRALGTWQHKIGRYIALSEFARQKYIAGGLPADRIVVKPNFVDLPRPAEVERSGFLFVGRLSEEKGVRSLLEAANRLPPGLDIQVAGTGPLQDLVAAHPRVRYLGGLAPDAVYGRMARAQALLMPSICYENFPRALVEAHACALPVLASRLGPLMDLIRPGVTGAHFEAGNASSLADCILASAAAPASLADMGAQARRQYEEHWSARPNLERLVDIYVQAIRQG